MIYESKDALRGDEKTFLKKAEKSVDNLGSFLKSATRNAWHYSRRPSGVAPVFMGCQSVRV
jgi:hypothetical protein